MNTLYLASQSSSRRLLLSYMNIRFDLLSQSADESACDWGLPLTQVVTSIAVHKMDHVQLPSAQEGDEIFVLTADTLAQNNQGHILGKPIDKNDAIRMLRSIREGSRVATACCLERKIFKNAQWTCVQRLTFCVEARCLFNVPDQWLNAYLENASPLNAAGAMKIEEYGSQFLQQVDGSYTAIMGLPLFELREALMQIGFYCIPRNLPT